MSKAHTFEHLVGYAVTSPWALMPEMLSVVASILSRRIVGEDTSPELGALAMPRRTDAISGSGVAVLPLHGVIAPRMNQFSDVSGGTTFEGATAELRRAVAAKEVGTIVLDWDSPGGNVQGASDFAAEIRKAKAVKPVISQVHYSMCSAAYWAGANASEIVAAPLSNVGGIGIYTLHNDLSAALAQLGIKRTYIAAGKFKVAGNETEPLSDETRARWQAEIDKAYDVFVRDVAAGRGVSPATVRTGFGEGAAVKAEEAITLGMIDRIGTLNDTITRAMSPVASPTLLQADAPVLPLTSQTPVGVAEAQAKERAWRTGVERQLLAWAVR